MTNELSHYGIRGMKWGVSRPRGSNGLVKKTVSSDHVETRDLKKKKLSELSNNEISRVNNRLQLEKTNKDLTSAGALRKIKVGTAAVGTVLAIGVTANTAMQFVSSPAGQAAKNLILKSLKS